MEYAMLLQFDLITRRIHNSKSLQKSKYTRGQSCDSLPWYRMVLWCINLDHNEPWGECCSALEIFDTCSNETTCSQPFTSSYRTAHPEREISDFSSLVPSLTQRFDRKWGPGHKHLPWLCAYNGELDCWLISTKSLNFCALTCTCVALVVS